MEQNSTPSSPRLRHPSVYWVTWVILAFLTPLAWLLLSFSLTIVSVVPVTLISGHRQSNIYTSVLPNIILGLLQAVGLFTIYAISQALVLTKFGINFRSWFVWTFAGMTVGLLSSILVVEIGKRYLDFNLMETSPIGSIIIGLLFGFSLGLMQSFSLRAISNNFRYWVIANMIAYTCGFLFFQLVWLEAVRVDDESAGFLLYCFLPFTTVIIGAITGLFLIWPIGAFKRIQSTAS